MGSSSWRIRGLTSCRSCWGARLCASTAPSYLVRVVFGSHKAQTRKNGGVESGPAAGDPQPAARSRTWSGRRTREGQRLPYDADSCRNAPRYSNTVPSSGLRTLASTMFRPATSSYPSTTSARTDNSAGSRRRRRPSRSHARSDTSRRCPASVTEQRSSSSTRRALPRRLRRVPGVSPGRSTSTNRWSPELNRKTRSAPKPSPPPASQTTVFTT